MKLIVDVPEEAYLLLKNFDWKSLPKEDFDEMAAYEYVIAQGVPFDEVKAKIHEAYEEVTMYSFDEQVSYFASKVSGILNDMSKEGDE